MALQPPQERTSEKPLLLPLGNIVAEEVIPRTRGDLLSIGAVFVGGFHHSPQIGYVSLVYARSAGQYIAAAGSTGLDQFAAVFFYLLGCACLYNR